MSHSQEVNFHDVRAVFRLLGEVRELGADPVAWNRHMLEGLTRLTHSHVGTALTFQLPPPAKTPALPRMIRFTDMGWGDQRQRSVFVEHVTSGNFADDPSCRSTIERLSGCSFTLVREQLVENREWYGSEHVNLMRRKADCDSFVQAQTIVPGTEMLHLFALYRSWSDRPLGQRERRLVALFRSELEQVWAARAARAAAENPLGALSPRLRQTLSCLLAGDSEKQAARKLGLSRHTVHLYVQGLHRHFGVSSRGELLAAVGRPRGFEAPMV